MISRVTEPLVALVITDYITRAFTDSGFEGDSAAAAKHLVQHITNPALGLWMAVSDGNVTGIVICVLPTSPLVAIPEIVVNSNWGLRQNGREMVMAAIDFVKAAGYDKLAVCNRTGKSDAVFQRLYNIPGRTMRPLGSLWEFMECSSEPTAT